VVRSQVAMVDISGKIDPFVTFMKRGASECK
jgi:hypothetical protein